MRHKLSSARVKLQYDVRFFFFFFSFGQNTRADFETFFVSKSDQSINFFHVLVHRQTDVISVCFA